MPATTETLDDYAATRARLHPDCWVCAPLHDRGLAVRFKAGTNGVVTGEFPCHEEFVGYPGLLHGGVISALLDGAMTNCLIARGTTGLTARFKVRFLKPVLIGRPATIRGWWEKSRGAVHVLSADLSQDGQVLATAAGRFMTYPE